MVKEWIIIYSKSEIPMSDDVWIVIEQSEKQISQSSYKSIPETRKIVDKIGGKLSVVIIGYNINIDEIKKCLLIMV